MNNSSLFAQAGGWDTDFDHKSKTMTNSFGNGVRVVLDYGNSCVTLLKNGEVLNRFTYEGDRYTMAEYERFLRSVEGGCELLKSFER